MNWVNCMIGRRSEYLIAGQMSIVIVRRDSETLWYDRVCRVKWDDLVLASKSALNRREVEILSFTFLCIED